LASAHWTILTEAVPIGWQNRLRRSARRLLTWRLDGLDLGHPSVTRSLARGLGKLGVAFTLNPISPRAISGVCMVLSSVAALRQAIEWKQHGKVRLLLAGPNLMVRSNEHGGILAAPEIDACVVPSEWVAAAYLDDLSPLSHRIRVWYAGVDEFYWAPHRSATPRTNALIYCKNADAELLRSVKSILEGAGWPTISINYGSYSRKEYRAALQKSKFAVFLSASESQGIALAESWAMDVPTLVWQPQELVIGGRRYTRFSSSPYLNEMVGARWTLREEFEQLVARLPALISTFSPRAWLLSNMTDVHAARRLTDIVDELLEAQTTSSTLARTSAPTPPA